MGMITTKQHYTCYNDCKQSGCPGHEMEVTYHTVSDGIGVKFDGKEYHFDPRTLDVFLDLLRSLDRAELSFIDKNPNQST